MEHFIKKMSISVIGLAFLAGIIVIAVSFMFDTTSRSEFLNHQEMESSDIFNRGWLPEYMPLTAKNIREKHNADLNIGFTTYEYDPNEIPEARKYCLESTENNTTLFLCPPFTWRSNILVLHQNGKGSYEMGMLRGIFTSNWLPSYFPKTAKNVEETYNSDSDDVFATFQYDLNETLKTGEYCVESTGEDGTTSFLCPPFAGYTNILVLHPNGEGNVKLTNNSSSF